MTKKTPKKPESIQAMFTLPKKAARTESLAEARSAAQHAATKRRPGRAEHFLFPIFPVPARVWPQQSKPFNPLSPKPLTKPVPPDSEGIPSSLLRRCGAACAAECLRTKREKTREEREGEGEGGVEGERGRRGGREGGF